MGIFMRSRETGATVSLRLPADLHRRSSAIAKQRGMSLNALTRQALLHLIEEEEKKALFDSFTMLGDNAEISDVEFAIYAQAEVMLG